MMKTDQKNRYGKMHPLRECYKTDNPLMQKCAVSGCEEIATYHVNFLDCEMGAYSCRKHVFSM